MKTKTIIALAALAFTPFAFGEEDHSGHDHAEHAEATPAGPHNGRILTQVEPHLEFFVREDRRIQLTFVDETGKAIAPAGQSVSAIGGDRVSPTRLAFAADGDSLLSDQPLPEGKEVPIVLMVKPTAESKSVPIKFNVNLGACPTCEHPEYACVCPH